MRNFQNERDEKHRKERREKETMSNTKVERREKVNLIEDIKRSNQIDR